MREAIFLPFDCESGGIGDEVSLLTAHFAACDEDWNIIEELELAFKPNETDETGSTLYKVTASALSINNIDLIAHDKVAMSYSQAGQVLREFLLRHSQNGKIKLQPMGKNIGGDVQWINNHILGKKTWSQYVSYRHYDITSLVTFLKRTGRMPWDAPESLEGLAKHFGYDGAWHTARWDNLAGIKVIKRLEDM